MLRIGNPPKPSRGQRLLRWASRPLAGALVGGILTTGLFVGLAIVAG